MKIFDIAIKDMTRSFRSTFAVVFMFGVPLLMTGMFYLMFGGTGKNSSAFTVPVTKVAVANLDKGSPSFDTVKAQFPAGTQASTMGGLVTSILQQQGFADIIQVTLVDSAEAARAAVDTQKAGAAIIIPADFSAKFSDLSGQAVIELYKDPTLTIGPSILQSVMNQIMDSMSGAKIAVTVVTSQTGQADSTMIGQVVQQYMAASQSTGSASGILDIQDVSTTKKAANSLVSIVGPIMGWLTIFYAFFTGASTAQSILREDEDGTLPRLFTTPTAHSTVLAGKFVAVGLTVVVQMIVLFALGHFIFGIAWGALLPVSLVIFGVILTAATFGIFINSMLKSTKQSGLIFGGLLTVLGMLGGIPIFAAGSASADTFAKVSLIEPVGWAVRGLLQNMSNAPLGDVVLTVLVMVAWSVLFFVVGVLRFQKRYA
jgi:ABC-2 type transport system permease protein